MSNVSTFLFLIIAIHIHAPVTIASLQASMTYLQDDYSDIIIASDTYKINNSSGGDFQADLITMACPTVDAYSMIEAESYCSQSGSIVIQGTSIGFIGNGSWIQFDTIDFGAGGNNIEARVASNTAGGTIEIRNGSPTGPILGTLNVQNTGGWNSWAIINNDISPIAGEKNIYFVFKGGSGGLFNIDWFQFYPVDCIASLYETQNQQIDQSRAAQGIIETNGIVSSGSSIDYTAGDYILMNPDFEVKLGAIFHAYIDPCGAPIIGCPAGNIEELRQCLESGENAILTQDITVDDSDCDGNAVLNLSGISGLGIYGQGFSIKRTAGQAQCSLVRGDATTTGFFSNNVVWEEVPGPEVPELNTYKHMFHFVNSSDVSFIDSEVAHSWGYAIYTNGVAGFKFTGSVLRDSGALGLYIGHSNNPTTDYEICNSVFNDNTTNALAILGGVNGCVYDNIFDNNHTLGIFPVAPQFGTGYTGGGQVYIAMANTLKFYNNTIQNGSCSNCVTAGVFVNPVTGLELGLPNQGTTVFNTTIDNNTIVNNTAWGAHLNANTTLDNTTQFCNNTISGNGNDIDGIPAANYKP